MHIFWHVLFVVDTGLRSQIQQNSTLPLYFYEIVSYDTKSVYCIFLRIA